MSDSLNSDESEQPVVRELDASLPVTITLPLHEVLGICLFEIVVARALLDQRKAEANERIAGE